MDFSLTEDQQVFRDHARGIAKMFEESYWQEIDKTERFAKEFWDMLAEKGILGIAIPEEYGGLGQGWLEQTIVTESLAEWGAGMDGSGMLVNGPVFGASLISHHGTDEQKEKFLPGLVKGDMWAGAFTEVQSGSNISAISTKAVLDGNDWVINGQKMFISQVGRSQYLIILARTQALDSEKKTSGVSLLYTELPNEGMEFQKLEKMGAHFLETGALFFDNMRVPKDNIIGKQGKAWGPLFDVLNPERFLIAATCVGTGYLCLRKATEFANDRKVWGGNPIGTHQGIAFPLAKAAIHLAGARLKVYEAAWLYDQGSPKCGIATAQAKYAACHAALEAADAAIQTFGGNGYIVETGLERHWRNLRLNRIAPITDEMALAFISQYELGLPRSY